MELRKKDTKPTIHIKAESFCGLDARGDDPQSHCVHPPLRQSSWRPSRRTRSGAVPIRGLFVEVSADLAAGSLLATVHKWSISRPAPTGLWGLVDLRVFQRNGRVDQHEDGNEQWSARASFVFKPGSSSLAEAAAPEQTPAAAPVQGATNGNLRTTAIASHPGPPER